MKVVWLAEQDNFWRILFYFMYCKKWISSCHFLTYSVFNLVAIYYTRLESEIAKLWAMRSCDNASIIQILQGISFKKPIIAKGIRQLNF